MNKKQFSGVSFRAHGRQQTEQRGNSENIPDCICMHGLLLSQTALLVLPFIHGEQTTASSKVEDDGENRQFSWTTSHGSNQIKTQGKTNLQPSTCMHCLGCDQKYSACLLL